jgi:predicted SAM-dependent methyltransferase
MRPTPKRIKALLASNNPINLDIGGADKGRNGWTTLDITDGCDLYWDLRKGIPFPDASVDAIYSSHLFEHLTYQQGQSVLTESMRVLKPGGTFSICVPNARIYIEGYLGVRNIPDEFYGWRPAFNETTAIDAVNYVAYMNGEHKYLFDIENLLHLLNSAGLTDVKERTLDPMVDRPERDYESIYAIGIKP